MMQAVYRGAAALAFAGARACAALDPSRWEGFEERSGSGGYVGARPVDVWIHGASVGEVGGLVSVVHELCERGDLRLHLSTTSLTGRAEAAKLPLENPPTLLPFDCKNAVSTALECLKPAVLAVAETEIWPELYRGCAVRGIDVLIFNGRISDSSFPRYKLLRPLLKHVFPAVSEFLVQSQVDRARFIELGADPGRVRVSGSTKYDRGSFPAPEELELFAGEGGIDRAAPVFVAGSVRPGELVQVLDAYTALLTEYPALQLIVAPRHPEKFDDAAAELERRGLDFSRRSSPSPRSGAKVLLLDSMGELSLAYALASVAFVGASLVPIGGHNPLEPAAFAVPVLVGPHMENQRAAVEQLAAAGAHLLVRGAEDIVEEAKKLLSRPELAAEIGGRARRVWEANLGATRDVVETIEKAALSRSSAGRQKLRSAL